MMVSLTIHASYVVQEHAVYQDFNAICIHAGLFYGLGPPFCQPEWRLNNTRPCFP
jgi:hypothetical protein